MVRRGGSATDGLLPQLHLRPTVRRSRSGRAGATHLVHASTAQRRRRQTPRPPMPVYAPTLYRPNSVTATARRRTVRRRGSPRSGSGFSRTVNGVQTTGLHRLARDPPLGGRLRRRRCPRSEVHAAHAKREPAVPARVTAVARAEFESRTDASRRAAGVRSPLERHTRVSAEALKRGDSDAAQTGGIGTAEGFAFT